MAITERKVKRIAGTRVQFEHHQSALHNNNRPQPYDYWAGLVPCGTLQLAGLGGQAYDFISGTTLEEAVAKVTEHLRKERSRKR